MDLPQCVTTGVVPYVILARLLFAAFMKNVHIGLETFIVKFTNEMETVRLEIQ